jgi:hypothetical protein
MMRTQGRRFSEAVRKLNPKTLQLWLKTSYSVLRYPAVYGPGKRSHRQNSRAAEEGCEVKSGS